MVGAHMTPRSRYFATSVIGALSGGLFPFINCTFASIADLTKRCTGAERASIFGVVQVSIFFGLTLGPIIGGLLAESVGVRLSFIFASSTGALQAVLTIMLFRETLEPGLRSAWVWKRANPFGSLHLLLQVCVRHVCVVCHVSCVCACPATAGGVDPIPQTALLLDACLRSPG